MKITFLGAGSTIFAKNVLGDCLMTPALRGADIALHDIGAERLKESGSLIRRINDGVGGGARITEHLGTGQRREALRGADFVVNAVQIGGYRPCTVTDFEIPRKYGLRQTIADTLGIGGIMRALRTVPFMAEVAREMEEVCPEAWLLNYTNPMAILAGYMLRHTGVKTVGLCHSVQVCVKELFEGVGMEEELDGHRARIAGINHMAWLLDIRDRTGKDLYPEIRKRAKAKNAAGKHKDMVRFDYIDKFGHYCTESSEHNAEYNPYYIKSGHPELIDRFNIPLDEYLRRCVEQIERWEEQGRTLSPEHTRSREYASRIMEAVVTDTPCSIGGNVLNNGCIANLPAEACVEVPCLVDGNGVTPCAVGRLPAQLAALNMTNINPQLLTIEAAATGKREHIYHAAFLDPHTAAELPLDDIVRMVDELIEAHGGWLPEFH